MALWSTLCSLPAANLQALLSAHTHHSEDDAWCTAEAEANLCQPLLCSLRALVWLLKPVSTASVMPSRVLKHAVIGFCACSAICISRISVLQRSEVQRGRKCVTKNSTTSPSHSVQLLWSVARANVLQIQEDVLFLLQCSETPCARWFTISVRTIQSCSHATSRLLSITARMECSNISVGVALSLSMLLYRGRSVSPPPRFSVACLFVMVWVPLSFPMSLPRGLYMSWLP